MSNEKNKKNRPRAVVGVFIFNENDELFMMKTVQWGNKYAVPGGGLENGETLEEAGIREVKEETNIDIKDLEYVGFTNAYDINEELKKEDNHLIFFDLIARVKGNLKIKLNKEGTKYKWLKIDDWIKRGKDFFPHKYELKILKNIRDKNYGYEYKYKLALADYQNLLRRTTQEKQEFAKYANENLIHEILPVYDNFKISLEHIDDEAKNSGLAEGIKYVVKQFKGVLETNGVKEMKIDGKKFDPKIMEAVDGKGKKIKKIIKAGYELRGKTISPAKVILE